ncbi:elongation factor G [Clostridium cellulovorans]|nr:elongation factor G [Clostridium cellulovorans]
MGKYKGIKNIVLLGHNGCGKTTLAEALLYSNGTITRMGTIEEGTTVSDYDSEERKRKTSINTTILPFERSSVKINLIDTPGYLDFIGEMLEGMRAADSAVICVSGRSGLKVGTERAYEYCKKLSLPRSFLVTKLDVENSKFFDTYEDIKNTFGLGAVAVQYPIGEAINFEGYVDIISETAYKVVGKEEIKIDIPEDIRYEIEKLHGELVESIAETSEELMKKYFEEGTLQEEDIILGLVEGFTSGELSPVFCSSAINGIGINALSKYIIDIFPKGDRVYKAIKTQTSEEIEVYTDEEKPFAAQIFKTIADPFVGKLSMFKVISGRLTSGISVYNANKEKEEKINAIYELKGKNQELISEIFAGDIGAIAKLQYSSTGDTLCDIAMPINFEKMIFPKPTMTMAIIPKNKGDEEKVSLGLSKLLEEDSTFRISRDIEHCETNISGIGETHLEILVGKLKNKFGADVILRIPKVPYRETIKATSDVQGKHKKQSGGHGQYGDVHIKFEPRDDGNDELLFVDQVVGGVVPRQYIPAVEKGLKECINEGVLAGYPVIRLKATLHYGSYHSVDSSEMAFKLATSIAYKKGLEQAMPVILEPIMRVEVFTPENKMGDVIGDLNRRRGRVLGMENEKDNNKIIAEVPLAEMFTYTTDLKALTGARGYFDMEFQGYEEVPPSEMRNIINSKHKEADLANL